jgi:multidrug efflux pump subunit AcrA (membrane-fusion protein)
MTASQLAVRETAPFAELTVRRLRRLLLEARRAQLERAAALVERDEADAVPAADRELVAVLAAQARQTVDEIDAALAAWTPTPTEGARRAGKASRSPGWKRSPTPAPAWHARPSPVAPGRRARDGRSSTGRDRNRVSRRCSAST